MVLYEIWYPKYDFLYYIEHNGDIGRYIKGNSWGENPKYGRRKLEREHGAAILFPGRPGRVW